MKLVIPITEVQQYVSSQYKIDVELENIKINSIKATYIDSVVLIMEGIKENVIIIHYEADGLANIASKVAHFFLDKKLNNTPIDWDSKNKNVIIDLNKMPQLKDFFKFIQLSDIQFIDDAIVLVMHARDTT